MNWGDELCGVKVTPEAWECGVWEEASSRQWHRYRPQYNGAGVTRADSDDYIMHYGTPIFPPRGWAGKSDAELVDAVFGGTPAVIGGTDDSPPIGFYPDKHGVAALLEIQCHPSYWARFGDPGSIGIDTLGAPALILALQNALVLHERLGGNTCKTQ